MYTTGQIYKLELKNKIFYTAKIIQEDVIQIKVLTKFNEELIINKDSIVQSKLLTEKGDSNE